MQFTIPAFWVKVRLERSALRSMKAQWALSGERLRRQMEGLCPTSSAERDKREIKNKISAEDGQNEVEAI